MGTFTYVTRRMLAAAQVEEFVGINALGQAVQRCARCASRAYCGPRAPFCANSALLLRAKVLAGVRS